MDLAIQNIRSLKDIEMQGVKHEREEKNISNNA